MSYKSLLGSEKTVSVYDARGLHDNVPWFFAGDIHGDLRCLTWILRYLESRAAFVLCFLGDLFDRGQHDAECFQALLSFANRFPNQVLWLAGNHDRCVDPAIKESLARTGWTNDLIERRNAIVPLLPKIALFDHGILAMHAGPPMVSVTGESYVPWEDRSFWRRYKHMKEIIVDDESPTFDGRDVLNFAKQHLKGFKPRTLIRGHDHPSMGVERYQEENLEVITLLASSTLGTEYLPQAHRPHTHLLCLEQEGGLRCLIIQSHGG